MKKILSLLFFAISFSLFATPKAVVFDFGGVLANPDEKIVKAFIMKTFNFPLVEIDGIKKARLEALASGISEEEFWLNLAKTKRITLPENWLVEFATIIKTAINVNSDMYALIEQLKKNEMPVALLSNIDDRAAKIVRDCGLYRPFEPCLLSCEIGVDKPNPKAYEMLIDKLSMLPHDVVFIDDLKENVEAARKAGIDAILFQSASQIREELAKRGCF